LEGTYRSGKAALVYNLLPNFISGQLFLFRFFETWKAELFAFLPCWFIRVGWAVLRACARNG